MTKPSKQLLLGPMPLERVQADARMPSVRAWVELVPTAMRRAGLSRKHASILSDISQQQLSYQLSYDGTDRREHLSLWRMRRWTPEFWSEFFELAAAYHGIVRERVPMLTQDELAAVRQLLAKAPR